MADDTPAPKPPAPSPAPAAPAAPAAPLMIMKGGTLSSSQEAANAAFMADTKRRWAERDEERAMGEQGVKGGFVADRAVDLGQPGTSAVAIIGYQWPGTDVYEFMQIDVVQQVDAMGAPDDAFVVVCPSCIQRGFPQTDCQLTVRKSNRKWELDMSVQGQLFFAGAGKVYTLAGKVICNERFRCPRPSCDAVYQVGEYPAAKRPSDPEHARLSTGMWRVK